MLTASVRLDGYEYGVNIFEGLRIVAFSLELFEQFVGDNPEGVRTRNPSDHACD